MSITDWQTILGKIGNLATLKTTAKKTIVEAINELKDSLGSTVTSASSSVKTFDAKPAFSNVTTESVLIAYVVPPSIVTGSVINFCIWGRAANTSGSSVNYRFRIRVGGVDTTIVLDTGNVVVPTTVVPNSRKWRFEGKILLTTVDNKIQAEFSISPNGSEVSPGMQPIASGSYFMSQTFGSNSSVPSEVKMTCQMGTANAAAAVQLEGAIFS
jgi:hypothetical protein